MERQFDEQSDENVDTEIAQAEPDDTNGLEILFEKAMKIKNNNMEIAKKGTLTKVMENRVNEVNDLIKQGNEKGIEVIDKSVTWQSPMKYKPFKYSNGVLYEQYEELDLYKANKGQGREWKLVKNTYTKGRDGIGERVTKVFRRGKSLLNSSTTRLINESPKGTPRRPAWVLLME